MLCENTSIALASSMNRRNFLGSVAALAVAPFVPTPAPVRPVLSCPDPAIARAMAPLGDGPISADFDCDIKPCGCYRVHRKGPLVSGTQMRTTEHYACAKHLPLMVANHGQLFRTTMKL